ncbi:MAG: hypothetical protein AVDCRST_MAG47-2693, partial [uncultured Nocardioidaceae bacterium]
ARADDRPAGRAGRGARVRLVRRRGRRPLRARGRAGEAEPADVHPGRPHRGARRLADLDARRPRALRRGGEPAGLPGGCAVGLDADPQRRQRGRRADLRRARLRRGARAHVDGPPRPGTCAGLHRRWTGRPRTARGHRIHAQRPRPQGRLL